MFIRFHVGPCAVKEIAGAMRSCGVPDVIAGTEHVLVRVEPGMDEESMRKAVIDALAVGVGKTYGLR